MEEVQRQPGPQPSSRYADIYPLSLAMTSATNDAPNDAPLDHPNHLLLITALSLPPLSLSLSISAFISDEGRPLATAWGSWRAAAGRLDC